jgi:hypothetical protein
MPSSINCITVSPACPVSSSIYGYYPSLGANAFCCSFFGVTLITNLLLGIRYKTWTFMIALSLGCLTEAIGYVAAFYCTVIPSRMLVSRFRSAASSWRPLLSQQLST